MVNYEILLGVLLVYPLDNNGSNRPARWAADAMGEYMLALGWYEGNYTCAHLLGYV